MICEVGACWAKLQTYFMVCKVGACCAKLQTYFMVCNGPVTLLCMRETYELCMKIHKIIFIRTKRP